MAVLPGCGNSPEKTGSAPTDVGPAATIHGRFLWRAPLCRRRSCSLAVLEKTDASTDVGPAANLQKPAVRPAGRLEAAVTSAKAA